MDRGAVMNRATRRKLAKKGVAETVITETQSKIELDTVMNYSAIVLWALRTKFGFSTKRMQQFHEEVVNISDHLKNGKTSGVTIESIKQALRDECGVTINL